MNAEKKLMMPLNRPPDAVVNVPGSKSITNRALIMAALAEGRSCLKGVLTAEDTVFMMGALRMLGIGIEKENNADTFTIEGTGGRLAAGPKELFLGNSGTSLRFLTALCTLGKGSYRLDGVARMRQRPQGDLLHALKQLGADAVSENGTDTPPLLVTGRGELPGGRATLNAEASSQFLTALLMTAPYADKQVEIEIEGELRPLYIEITRRMMQQWGVASEAEGASLFRVEAGQRYRPQPEYFIEPDASSASYFFAAAALTGGRVRVEGLTRNALQGDVRFATDVLAAMGCLVEADEKGITVQGPPPGELKGVERDMSAISDTSLTLAALAPFASTPTVINNIAHSRLQECDRITAACTELKRLGVSVEERPDGFTVYPSCPLLLPPVEIETYNDHRVAMSFALIGLRVPGITILNPGSSAKTFPDYWERLEKLRK